MMGLRTSVFAVGWYLIYTLVTAVPCLLLASLASGLGFYKYTGFGPIFVLCFLCTGALSHCASEYSCAHFC